MKEDRLALRIAFFYIAISGLVMFVLNFCFGYPYGDYRMLKAIISFEVLMFVYAILAYRMYFKNHGVLKLEIPRLTPTFIIFSLGIVATFIVFLSTGDFAGNYELFISMVLFALFISMTEELIFRGIILEVFLKKYSILSAVFLSSLVYACTDIVNILGGVSFKEMIMQFLEAFVLGILLACFAIQIKNIVPIMMLHWVWDLMAISFVRIESKAGLGILIISILGIVSAFFLLLKLMHTSPTKNVIESSSNQKGTKSSTNTKVNEETNKEIKW
ncbi:hypothetical protein SAMN05421767_11319 [Granulicatella balaenopterae]|uniref:CAAX prenyl protease 2/Lysostaphin resistance protein A-like domain-containing protein n=1 Tax=Granulicatella balaenopterae TaxID=137733 RepID=A0A1H9KEB3_9LACT|nr:CPBP family intramembrane glutamic endopeptidase [Granulicatella balaenopterae]SEQ97452.1 hypothetical protein SAMN05421767_11319 [Granulicatella balaenopterae]